MLATKKQKSSAAFQPKLLSGQALLGYAFITPAVLALALLVTYPLLYGAYISFFKTNLVNKWDFVGLKYYGDILANPQFYKTVLLTLGFALLVVVGHFIVGFALASALNRKGRGILFFRTVLMLPWLFPEAVLALLFKWILNPLYGLMNHLLMSVGLINEYMTFLGDAKYAFIAVVLVCIWKGYPMVMMMLLAGMQGIPGDLYEAASIDGATRWQRFRYITIPTLKPVILVAIILDTVWWFKHYTMVWVLTTGGPGSATSLISIDIYKTAFEFFNFGKAAASSILVFFICYLLSRLYRRVLNED